MWRWTRRILASIVGLLRDRGVGRRVLSSPGDSRKRLPHTRHLDDSSTLSGHRLHIWCTGSGVPTVVLGHAGSAARPSTGVTSSRRWRRSRTSARTTELGMGYSDPGPRPRTSEQIVRELAALLDRSGVPGRVIFVGASIGGWNVRLFASTHTERAAGLVLVDARHENQGEAVSGRRSP